MSSENTTDGAVRLIVIIVAALLLAPLLMMLLAVPMMGMWGGMMGYGFDGAMGYSPLWGLGIAVVWLVVLVGGGYLLYRWFAGSGGDADRALEELRLAYARGDLTDEEFEERRSKLEGD